MFENLKVFSMAQAMAGHASARQAIIAENIANADTPGYRARDLKPFSETYRTESLTLPATRTGHFLSQGTDAALAQARPVYRPGAASPNGNTVSLENEIFAAADAKSEHDRALAIYRSALNILRTSASSRG